MATELRLPQRDVNVKWVQGTLIGASGAIPVEITQSDVTLLADITLGSVGVVGGTGNQLVVNSDGSINLAASTSVAVTSATFATVAAQNTGNASLSAINTDTTAIKALLNGTGSIGIAGTVVLGTGINSIGSVGQAGTWNVGLTGAIPAGSAIIGKVGIDQTTPGTTNGVQVNAALPAGSNIIGAVGINQTNPGSSNAVTVNKRTGATSLAPNYVALHITTNASTPLIGSTGYISSIVISCTGAGTAWTLKIQNAEGTPKVLVPNFTLTVPSTGQPIVLNFNEPILMTTGTSIVTAGTTPGIVDVFCTYFA